MKRTLLSLAICGLTGAYAAFAAPAPSTQNVNVVNTPAVTVSNTPAVTVTNTSNNPVNVSVVSNASKQAVNFLGWVTVTSSLRQASDTIYNNTGTSPVMITTVGLADAKRWCVPIPLLIRVRVVVPGTSTGAFAIPVTSIPDPLNSNECLLSAVLSGGIVVPPGGSLVADVWQNAVTGATATVNWYFAASGYTLE